MVVRSCSQEKGLVMVVSDETYFLVLRETNTENSVGWSNSSSVDVVEGGHMEVLVSLWDWNCCDSSTV